MPLPAYYHSTPNLNVSINGINIGEGMQRADMNNALRQMMADIKDWTDSYAVTFPIAIAEGGTGAITAAAAIAALGGLPNTGGTVVGNVNLVGDTAIDGNLFNASNGVYPFWSDVGMTVGAMFIQALGADPTSNPGDMVFEY